MGFWDFLKRGEKKKAEKKQKFVLVRKGVKGGYEKVMDLERMMTPDELYPALAAGVYCIHVYEEGRSGFDSTEAFRVIGEEEEKEEKEGAEKSTSPFAGLRAWATEMKGARDDIVSVIEILGPMAGFQKVGEGAVEKPKSLIQQLRDAKADQKELNDIFPQSTTGTKDIPISGSIPAALVYAPQVVDQTMDAIEKRMQRWGVIEQGGGTEKEEIIKMPEKPKAVKEKAKIPEKAEEVEEKEKIEVEEEGIKMPEKPKIPKSTGDEVKVERLEDLEKEGKGDGGKGKSKPAK